eukprot:sb/3468008/
MARHLSQDCTKCGKYLRWATTKMKGGSNNPQCQTQMVNADFAAAMALTGMKFSPAMHFMELLGAPTFTRPVYDGIMDGVLYPEVERVFKADVTERVNRLKGLTRVILRGDGQYDSPGHSAKYCTYTLIDDEGYVVALVVVQKNEKGVEGELEAEGAKRAILQLEQRGVKITDIATDRHKTLATWLKLHRPHITHHFDMWHLVRNYRNKLMTMAGAKAWCKSIEQHLWWCAANCGGDPDKLISMVHSGMLHILDVHSFTTKKAQKIWAKIQNMKVSI